MPSLPAALRRLPAWLPPERLLSLALLLVFLGVGVQYFQKSSDNRSAFNRWRVQVQELVAGVDVYQKHLYPNAPIMGLILYPLSLLPRIETGTVSVDVGALAWFVLKIGMALLSFCWCFRLCEEAGRPFPFWAQALTVLLALRPIVGDLQHGNVNLLILFLVTAMLRTFQRKQDFAAGLLLALAITCKVTPALFVPYFLWKRAWKSLAGCAVGLLLFFSVVPGLILGFGHTLKITRSWTEKMILPFTVHGEVTTEHQNQSLPGLTYRLLTKSPSFLDEDDQPADYHNIAELPTDTARLIVKLCGFAFLGLLCFFSQAPLEPRTQSRLAAEYALVVLGMLLFSERTWKHHCVTLLLPYGVLCHHLATYPLSRTARLGFAAVLAGSVLLMATASTSLWEGLGDFKHGAKLAQVYGVYVWTYLLLIGAVAAAIRQKARRPRAEIGLRLAELEEAPTRQAIHARLAAPRAAQDAPR